MPTGYYQEQQNKEKLQKEACESYQIFLKKRKTKNVNIIANTIKISLNIRNKG